MSKKYLAVLVVCMALLGMSRSPASAQTNYLPVLFLRADSQSVVVGDTLDLSIIGNTLGNTLRRVEAYVTLEGDAVPFNTYGYGIDPGKADLRFNLHIYEDYADQGRKILHMMMSSPYEDGANWGSEAVPLYHIYITPTSPGTINAYLDQNTTISYNDQTSGLFDNYTTASRPYVITVLPSSQPTPTPTSIVTTPSQAPVSVTPSPTKEPSVDPDYNHEYEQLKAEVAQLKSEVNNQNQRLSLLETFISKIKAFLNRIFNF
jgi:hypothetical protein